MARELDDLEFWLPSEFLTDDDLLTDFKADRLKTKKIDDFSCGFGNSFGLNWDLSSPTTETESDDDDLVSELTRKFTHSTLQDSNLSADYAANGWKLPGSPQSTLCGCKPGPQSSPNSVSGVCSPTEAEDHLRWDLLYAAAGEVARMRMIEETAAFYSSKLFLPQPKPSPVTASQQSPNPASGFYPNQAQTHSHLSYQLLQAAKFQQMKQNQMLKNRVYGQGAMDYQLQNGRRHVGEARAQDLSMTTWPTLQQMSQQQPQQPGSGMRAFFLGESGVKKERTGTGVFLPKRFGSVPAETRKKPGCSTVLLPERVVHALNSQVQHRGNGSFNADYDVALKQRNSLAMAQRRRSLMPQPVMNQQPRLPQEWTY